METCCGAAHLFVDRRAFPEHDVAPNEAGHERIQPAFFTSVRAPLDEHDRLVDRHELGKVQRVRLRRAEDRA